MRPVGLYFSSDRNDSDAWPHYINKLVKGIQIDYPTSCLTLQLKNSLLENKESFCLNATHGPRHPQLVLAPATTAAGAGGAGAGAGYGPRELNAMIDSFLGENLHRSVQDLEDHSDATHLTAEGADFRNGCVGAAVSEYMRRNH
jgi:hypothetical protein